MIGFARWATTRTKLISRKLTSAPPWPSVKPPCCVQWSRSCGSTEMLGANRRSDLRPPFHSAGGRACQSRGLIQVARPKITDIASAR